MQSVLRAKLKVRHRGSPQCDGRATIRDSSSRCRSTSISSTSTSSLRRSLDMFVALYNDPSANIDSLCDRFTQYEVRPKVADIREGKMGDASGSAIALSSRSSSSTKGKGKGKKGDLTDVTCYGCGKKGHLRLSNGRKGPTASRTGVPHTAAPGRYGA